MRRLALAAVVLAAVLSHAAPVPKEELPQARFEYVPVGDRLVGGSEDAKSMTILIRVMPPQFGGRINLGIKRHMFDYWHVVRDSEHGGCLNGLVALMNYQQLQKEHYLYKGRDMGGEKLHWYERVVTIPRDRPLPFVLKDGSHVLAWGAVRLRWSPEIHFGRIDARDARASYDGGAAVYAAGLTKDSKIIR
jgi:hypothetical protein